MWSRCVVAVEHHGVVLQRLVDRFDAWGRRHRGLDTLVLLIAVVAVVAILAYGLTLWVKAVIFVTVYLAVMGLVSRRRRREGRERDTGRS
jgi:Flp pilus assembly protein TadB